jgi:predicted secreted hydrolase
MHQYGPEDEGTHAPGDHEWWQESVYLHWYDAGAGLGGVHRLGHEPNRDGGRTALQCGVFAADGTRFRRDDFQLRMQPPTSERGFRSGGSSWHVEDGVPRIEVHEDGLDLNLRMTSFYPPTGFFPSGGSLVEDFAKNHYETSGTVSGTVSLAGRSYDVNGLCHRDHSWGTRLPSTLLSHRWVSGTFGPSLSFGSIVWHSVDGAFVKTGYVVRDGEATLAEDMDVLVWLEADGLTHRGGRITWYLTTGEEITLDARLIDGYVCHKHHVYYVDGLCEVRLGDQVGYCDLEISNNARHGDSDVTFALSGDLADGLSVRTPYPALRRSGLVTPGV